MMSSVLSTSENHLHAIIILLLKIYFTEPWNLEYISITKIFNIVCLAIFNIVCLSQNPTWLPYWLTLLAQVPRLGDVQLLFQMDI